MTQLEVIRMIGDVLTDIDVVAGSLQPNDPSLQHLMDLRIVLDNRQLMLSKQVFDDNTPEFQAAAEQLQTVNNTIQGTIQHINNIATVIGNVTTFLNSVTSLMTTIGALV
jgi:hypothetical protein